MRRLCEEKGKSRRLEKKIFKDFYLNSSCGYKFLSQNFETSVLQMLKKKKKNSNHITIMPLFLWQSTSLWVIYYIESENFPFSLSFLSPLRGKLNYQKDLSQITPWPHGKVICSR